MQRIGDDDSAVIKSNYFRSNWITTNRCEMVQVWSNWSEILAASYRDEQNQIEGSLPSTQFLNTIQPTKEKKTIV